MTNERSQLSAYHEAGCVVLAYLNGYSCDVVALPETGNITKLNPGNDIEFVKHILSGGGPATSLHEKNEAINVAKKLITVACAGTCAEVFFENGGNMPEELEMEIPGRDLVNIEKAQAFLEKAIDNHPDDFPTRTIISVFKKLSDKDTWKAIELLAAKILESDGQALSRFYIEDTLMMAGINPRKTEPLQNSTIGVHEDKTEKQKAPETGASGIDFSTITPLDIMVRDFLKKIKTDWKDGELNEATQYLHGIYKEYGN